MLLPGFYIGGSHKGNDGMINFAPFVIGQMEASPQLVRFVRVQSSWSTRKSCTRGGNVEAWHPQCWLG